MEITIVDSNSLKITAETVDEIHKACAQEEGLAYRSKGFIQKRIQGGNMLFALDEKKKIAGWIGTSHIYGNWHGLFMLFVYPEYRGYRIGTTKLLPAAINSFRSKYLYAATSRKSVHTILKKHGFQQVKLRQLPFLVLCNLLLSGYEDVKSFRKFFIMKRNGLSYYVRRLKN